MWCAWNNSNQLINHPEWFWLINHYYAYNRLICKLTYLLWRFKWLKTKENNKPTTIRVCISIAGSEKSVNILIHIHIACIHNSIRYTHPYVFLWTEKLHLSLTYKKINSTASPWKKSIISHCYVSVSGFDCLYVALYYL